MAMELATRAIDAASRMQRERDEAREVVALAMAYWRETSGRAPRPAGTMPARVRLFFALCNLHDAEQQVR